VGEKREKKRGLNSLSFLTSTHRSTSYSAKKKKGRGEKKEGEGVSPTIFLQLYAEIRGEKGKKKRDFPIFSLSLRFLANRWKRREGKKKNGFFLSQFSPSSRCSRREEKENFILSILSNLLGEQDRLGGKRKKECVPASTPKPLAKPLRTMGGGRGKREEGGKRRKERRETPRPSSSHRRREGTKKELLTLTLFNAPR